MWVEKTRIHTETVLPKYIKRKRDKEIQELNPKTYDPSVFYGYDKTELISEIKYFIKKFGKNPESWDEMLVVYSEMMNKAGDERNEGIYHYIRLKYFVFDERAYIRKLEEIANENVVDAQMDCVRYYSAHNDEEKMMYWITRAAKNGDSEAQMQLADKIFFEEYRNGLSDGKEAVEWYERSAYEGKNPHAIRRLISLYNDGVIVNRDIRKARKLAKMLGGKLEEYI